MDSYEVAYELASYILSHCELQLPIITARFCPHAIGSDVDGMIVPSPLVLRNEKGQEYVHALETNGVKGLASCLELLAHLRNKMQLDLLSFGNLGLFFYTLGEEAHTYKIPLIEQRLGFTRSSVVVRYVTLKEYCMYFNFKTTTPLLIHLVQFVLFGFPFTSFYVREVFGMEEDRYLGARLFQGQGETFIDGATPVSHFIPENEDMESLEQVTAAMSEMQQLLEVRTQFRKKTVLGFNSEIWTALTRSPMFSFPEERYKRYLTSPSAFQKVGYSTWCMILYGEKDRADFNGSYGDQQNASRYEPNMHQVF